MAEGGRRNKPLIGITGRQYRYGDVAGTPRLLADALVDAVLADYVKAVVAAGGLAVHIPVDVDADEILDALDGLILTGGADLDPATYHAEPAPESHPPDPVRDRYELALAEAAVDSRLPTLGVCRGMQVLTAATGGTLHQHLESHPWRKHPELGAAHEITTEPDSVLAHHYGPRPLVNSYHHQSVDRPGDGFTITARTDDGEIEGVEYGTGPIVAVQWHPELMPKGDPIFDWLVEAASG